MSKGYIQSRQDSLFGHSEIVGFGESGFYVEEIDRNKANKIIVENHYSGKYYNATYIHLGVFFKGILEGVLQYGYAMNPASQASVVSDTAIDEYLELNRMWLSDKCPRNSESKAISYSIKYIRKKYPKIKWLQSFADERCGGLGIVYQAANFGYYGEHTATFWVLDNEVYHNSLMTRDPSLSVAAAKLQDRKDEAIKSELRQFRYLFFIWKKWESRCLLKRTDYPKHYAK